MKVPCAAGGTLSHVAMLNPLPPPPAPPRAAQRQQQGVMDDGARTGSQHSAHSGADDDTTVTDDGGNPPGKAEGGTAAPPNLSKPTYRGTYRYKGKWVARGLGLGGKPHNIGTFDTEEEAARGYNEWAKTVWINPVLNFLPDGSLNPDRKKHQHVKDQIPLVDIPGLSRSDFEQRVESGTICPSDFQGVFCHGNEFVAFLLDKDGPTYVNTFATSDAARAAYAQAHAAAVDSKKKEKEDKKNKKRRGGEAGEEGAVKRESKKQRVPTMAGGTSPRSISGSSTSKRPAKRRASSAASAAAACGAAPQAPVLNTNTAVPAFTPAPEVDAVIDITNETAAASTTIEAAGPATSVSTDISNTNTDAAAAAAAAPASAPAGPQPDAGPITGEAAIKVLKGHAMFLWCGMEDEGSPEAKAYFQLFKAKDDQAQHFLHAVVAKMDLSADADDKVKERLLRKFTAIVSTVEDL